MLGSPARGRGPHGGCALSPASPPERRLPTQAPSPSRDAAAVRGGALPPRGLWYVSEIFLFFFFPSPPSFIRAFSLIGVAMPGRNLVCSQVSKWDHLGEATGMTCLASPPRYAGARVALLASWSSCCSCESSERI